MRIAIKFILALLLIVVSYYFFYASPEPKDVSTVNPDVVVGNDDNKKIIKCLPSQRDADVCIQIYKPVCASVNVQCVTTPCNPIKETFSNSCHACANSLVEEYTEGACTT